MTRLLTAYGAGSTWSPSPHPVGGWQQARRERVDRAARRAPRLPGARTSTTTPTTSPPTPPLALELACPARPHRRPGVQRRAPAATPPASRACCAGSTPRLTRGRRRHHRLDHLRPARRHPADARPRVSSIHPRNVAYDTFNEVHWVAAPEAVWACRAAGRSSHYATGGWSVGAVALVARWLAASGPRPTPRIVAIFPDGPQRYSGHRLQRRLLRRQRPARTSRPHPNRRRSATPASGKWHRWTRCTTVVDPLAAPTPRGRSRGAGPPDEGHCGARPVRSYERSVQLLMVNQFTINLGFYMLMPYLAAHLSGTSAWPAWAGRTRPGRTELQPAGHVPGRRHPRRPVRLQAADRGRLRAAHRRFRDRSAGRWRSRPCVWPPRRPPGSPGPCSTRPSGLPGRGRGRAPGRGVRAVQRLLPGRHPARPAGRHGADWRRLPGRLPGLGRGSSPC